MKKKYMIKNALDNSFMNNEGTVMTAKDLNKFIFDNVYNRHNHYKPESFYFDTKEDARDKIYKSVTTMPRIYQIIEVYIH